MVFVSRELKRLAHPHYIINLILSLSFFCIRKIPPICSFLFDSCEISSREQEILFFMLVVIALRTRKQGGRSILPYVSLGCMFAKMGNVLLYFYSDPLYGIIFSLVCLLQMLILPEPSYQGPENIVYLRNEDLENALRDKGTTWMVEMYTSWNPACVDFASHFSELSAKFSLENFKFGKVDLARNPETATKYRISTSAMSKQLPTLILFEAGQEDMRRPQVDVKGRLIKFPFNYENVVTEYDLNGVHKKCKERLAKKANSKKEPKAVEHAKSE